MLDHRDDAGIAHQGRAERTETIAAAAAALHQLQRNRRVEQQHGRVGRQRQPRRQFARRLAAHPPADRTISGGRRRAISANRRSRRRDRTARLPAAAQSAASAQKCLQIAGNRDWRESNRAGPAADHAATDAMRHARAGSRSARLSPRRASGFFTSHPAMRDRGHVATPRTARAWPAPGAWPPRASASAARRHSGTAASRRSRRAPVHAAGTSAPSRPSSITALGRPSARSRPTGLPISSSSEAASRISSAT